MIPKFLKLTIVSLFIIALSLPVLLADKLGGDISDNERRVLASFPEATSVQTLFTHKFKEGFEVWLKDNMWARFPAQQISGTIDYRIFDVSPSSLVHVGDNGWLYYRGDKNLELALGTNFPDLALLEKIRLNQELIQEELKDRGIEYVIVLVPSKVSVYPENIKGGKFAIRETYIDIVTRYLQEHTTIPVINLKPVLIEAKKTKQVFLKTETHWNHAGAYIGYSTVIRELQKLGLLDTEPVEITTKPGTFLGDLSAMMGSTTIIPPEPMDYITIEAPKAVPVTEGEKHNTIQSVKEQDNVLGYFSFHNDTKTKKLLILGDSFFYTWKIPELFAENFNQLDYLFSDKVFDNIVTPAQPDVVILERAERYIYSLAFPPDTNLLTKAFANPNAELSLIEEAETITVNAVNKGDEDWTNGDLIRLGVFVDVADTGVRYYLPEGSTIKPGEILTIVIERNSLPDGNSGKQVSFKMLQEGFQYFGGSAVIQGIDK